MSNLKTSEAINTLVHAVGGRYLRHNRRRATSAAKYLQGLDEDTRELVSRSLKEKGYELDEAICGWEYYRTPAGSVCINNDGVRFTPWWPGK